MTEQSIAEQSAEKFYSFHGEILSVKMARTV